LNFIKNYVSIILIGNQGWPCRLEKNSFILLKIYKKNCFGEAHSKRVVVRVFTDPGGGMDWRVQAGGI